MTEGKGKKVIQIQKFIQSTGEGAGHAAVQAAEQPVLLGCPPSKDAPIRPGLSGFGFGKPERNGKIAELQLTSWIACFHHALHKALQHTAVWKCDGTVHRKFLGGCKSSRPETGQPPVTSPDCKQFFAFSEQFYGHREQLIIRDTVEECGRTFCRREQGIRPVNADFSACIDSILPLPELDKPSSLPIRKIDGLTVKDHAKTRGGVIEQGAIAKFPLRGVQSGRYDIFLTQIGKSKRLCQFVQNLRFFAGIHLAELSDDALFPVTVQKKEDDA